MTKNLPNLPRGRQPKKRGRPPYAPSEETRNIVKNLVGMVGMTQDQICAVVGISKPTLEKHFRRELDEAGAHATLMVATNLFNIATSAEHKSAAQAAIFWMKARGGWRETNRMELTGKDGQPIQAAIGAANYVDPRDLSPEQRDQLRSIIETAVEHIEHKENEDFIEESEEDEDEDEED